ncbi:MAG: asparagine synthase (glutamine-hydrolyzing), partial [Terriglobales bacterium]
MCGIAGFFTHAPLAEHEAQRILQTFARAIRHRGPDGEGFYLNGTVGLVHRRLAVIDPIGGHQPIIDPGGNVLVANAEIYNYRQLRSELLLEQPELSLSSNSDCAPILPIYRKYGTAFVDRLRGMFGLALYDPNSDSGKERLLLARDPFGIKPLYYAQIDPGFFFASEIDALKQVLQLIPGVEPALNHASRNALLELQFTPGADTIWNPIVRVRPGETIVVEDGRVVDKVRREALPQLGEGTAHGHRSADISPALMEELDAVLRDSVSLHLQSDVPVGLFLSGGVDSTTLLTIATQDLKQPLHTFTIGFPDADVHDEREQARSYATNPLITHHEAVFTCDDFWTFLPQVAQALDDPVADYASVPIFKLASIAKEHVKVILSGEGGDEMFAGYDQYQHCLKH